MGAHRTRHTGLCLLSHICATRRMAATCATRQNCPVLSAGGATLAVLLLASAPALAADIYRHRPADGRTVFSDNATPPPNTVESSRVSRVGGRLLAPSPAS